MNPGFPGPGRTDNCVNCAIAADSTFSGRPASALPFFDRRGLPLSEIPRALNLSGRFARANGLNNVTEIFEGFGPGAKGIVAGDRGPGKPGHVFNVVVNKRGVVSYWDAQSRSRPVIAGQGYKSFS
ncbi:toxin glutamine deamidase domain-containing protein [Microcoleus sp. herbarium8]|uniref:toxin glutamine deamidase domain-containing protein n=1 Tax=Microcoleus sp. herbarium8 TaxID=3055436 RepID=UPI0034DEEF9A